VLRRVGRCGSEVRARSLPKLMLSALHCNSNSCSGALRRCAHSACEMTHKLMPSLHGLTAVVASLLLCNLCEAQEHTSIQTEDGAFIAAYLYGSGTRSVVLAHGGRRTKADWAMQARILAANGFRVLAFDFRGFGESPMPPPSLRDDDAHRFDILAAVRYLRDHGAVTVSVVGASFGGTAAAEASVNSAPGEIDRLVLLAHGSSNHPELIKGRKLFIVSRGDTDGSGATRLAKMREDYRKVRRPKRFVILDGTAHAQFIFETDQGDRLMKEILQFLSGP
jgi:dienelactone hydrolase